MPHLRVRTGAVLCGVATILAGCAQDPGVMPGAPDNCVLLCAVVRSIVGIAEPEPFGPPAPPRIVREAKRPGPARPRSELRPALAPVAPEGGPLHNVLEDPVASAPPQRAVSTQARATDLGKATPTYRRLPGSAPIELVTSRFVPWAAQQP